MANGIDSHGLLAQAYEGFPEVHVSGPHAVTFADFNADTTYAGLTPWKPAANESLTSVHYQMTAGFDDGFAFSVYYSPFLTYNAGLGRLVQSQVPRIYMRPEGDDYTVTPALTKGALDFWFVVVRG